MKIGTFSNKGNIRQSNQDYLGLFLNQTGQVLAVLCDGMGGHRAGDVASELATETLGRMFQETENLQAPEAKAWLADQVPATNAVLLDRAEAETELKGMGTTLIALIPVGSDALIANVGDSRAYRFAQGTLTLLTEDQTFVNELLKKGEINPEEAENHPQRHVLVSTMGSESQFKVDLYEEEMPDDSKILLCSDGLYNSLSLDQMETILASTKGTQEAAQVLGEQALEHGGEDNISLILIEGGPAWKSDTI